MKTAIIRNANILTLDPKRPYANEMIIKGGLIVELGRTGELSFPKTAHDQIFDLKGSAVLPGFIDSHLHMLTAGLTKLQVDLNNLEKMCIPAMLALVKKQAPEEGWVRAFGLEEARLAEGRMPTCADLDEVFPERPVIITRVCGHVSAINSAAMKAVGIGQDVENINGGEFKRDASGRLTGLVAERAQQYVLDRIPPYRDALILSKLAKEQVHLLQNGVCSIHDAGTDQIGVPDYVRNYIRFYGENKLKLRTYLMIRPIAGKSYEYMEDYLNGLKQNYRPEKDRLYFGAVKLFADGSIGGRTAGVYEAYAGEPGNKGLLLDESLDYYVTRCHASGFQVSVHAIGDRAAEYAIDRVIEGNRHKPRAGHRHRVEHCELCSPSIINKLAENGILAMMQPAFIHEFGAGYQRNLTPERAARIKPIKTLLSRGVGIGFGTDYPVVSVNPFLGLDDAMRRIMGENGRPLNQEECIDLMQALRCYTLGSAFGSFTEQLQGTLEIGKFGDYIAVDKSLEQICLGGIRDCLVEQTAIGGEVLFSRI